ncbi:PREDICTED: EGF and laminin G domain-containing protein-like [Acropora digitifera]|uniref:EGF and laminin G domain-containing protein-like n=1 Tax=Acropora digitifera TaxID=70779 RepID=UPI000779F3DC|nr:PREDICTED: EGF and laminin G domain-containing protein-like [Acropora digitifera]
MGSNNKNIERWCEYTMQASYTMNLTLHRAINTTPYEAVFGITAHRENHQNTDEDIKCQGETTELASGKNTLDNDQCETLERAAKRQKIRERQSQYYEEMVKQTSQSRKAPFKIDDMIAIKIDRVDKTSPVHANMLLGKIMEIRKNYAKIVTPQGIIKGNNEKLGFWVSSNGVYQSYWGGAKQGSRSCACGETNPNSWIDRTKKCNCDAGLDKWYSDEGYLNSTTLLPVVEVMFKGVTLGTEANFTVGHLYCAGEISNTATFVNEDGFIKLKAWSPPSNGVISLFFKTPYKKGVLLYNGMLDKDFFRVEIINENSVDLSYNIGNGVRKIELSLGENQVNDRSWHHVVIYHNMKVFGIRLDNQEGKHENPLFLKRELNLDNELYVGGYPYHVSKGFVGCIRGLDINGEVQDLSKLAGEAEFMKSGCGAACENNSCKNHAKCLDNYNVYLCDCSKTPYYGYFCHKENGTLARLGEFVYSTTQL